jgi:hypothetical protein
VKRTLGLILFLGFSFIAPALIFGSYAQAMQNHWARQAVFWAAALAASLGLSLWAQRDEPHPLLDRWWKCVLIAAILQAGLYVAASHLPDISTYPLTMGWSETSRYYNASLFFSRRIYGVSTPPTVLHPSRYLLQAVPFLLGDFPLWFHRAWQVFLWLVMPTLTALVLVRRFQLRDRVLAWAVFGVTFVYLMIGPVYYHLLVPVILMLWLFHTGSNQPMPAGQFERWRGIVSLFALLVASAWAGISRVNWFPMPGMLAIALILMERPIEPVDESAPGPRYLPTWPALVRYVLRLAGWGIVGVATAVASQALYIFWSGNEAEHFTTSFTSDLLWRRLLPNASFPLGLLPAISIVSLPVFLVILGKLLDASPDHALWKRVHWLRWLGLAGELAILFVGGAIVSVKIGGGSNLHNMDAYMVLLLIVGMYFYLDRVKADFGAPPAEQPRPALRRLPPEALINGGVALMVIASAFFTVYSRKPPAPFPAPAVVQAGLEQVTKFAQRASQQGGEVLFLTNRHLLTFGMIEGVKLAPEYERVFLMEAAMSNAVDYLGQFRKDMEQQRFAVIISEPLSTRYKSPHESFGSENNAWVRRVSQIVLCYYYPVETLRELQMQILIPRANVRKNCPTN